LFCIGILNWDQEIAVRTAAGWGWGGGGLASSGLPAWSTISFLRHTSSSLLADQSEPARKSGGTNESRMWAEGGGKRLWPVWGSRCNLYAAISPPFGWVGGGGGEGADVVVACSASVQGFLFTFISGGGQDFTGNMSRGGKVRVGEKKRRLPGKKVLKRKKTRWRFSKGRGAET
jgi:hypothetical protein